MSITIWAFKDQASDTVRITPNDPASEMGLRSEVAVDLPGGFSLRDFRRNLDGALDSLTGATGEEAYLKLVLDDLSPAALTALMTAPAP